MNGEWLLAHPKHSSSAWTALQGVTVLPVVMIAFAILAWPCGWMDTSVSLLGETPLRFLGVALMIGLLCSWVAMLCWNQMSQRLPSGLGGQLIVFESISAVVYALIWRGEWPTITMVIGFAILLVGVMCSLYVFGKSPAQKENDPKKRARPRRRPRRLTKSSKARPPEASFGQDLRHERHGPDARKHSGRFPFQGSAKQIWEFSASSL